MTLSGKVMDIRDNSIWFNVAFTSEKVVNTFPDFIFMNEIKFYSFKKEFGDFKNKSNVQTK